MIITIGNMHYARFGLTASSETFWAQLFPPPSLLVAIRCFGPAVAKGWATYVSELGSIYPGLKVKELETNHSLPYFFES
jgi:hypothetical protein